jgi:hypothetical protein
MPPLVLPLKQPEQPVPPPRQHGHTQTCSDLQWSKRDRRDYDCGGWNTGHPDGPSCLIYGATGP